MKSTFTYAALIAMLGAPVLAAPDSGAQVWTGPEVIAQDQGPVVVWPGTHLPTEISHPPRPTVWLLGVLR